MWRRGAGVAAALLPVAGAAVALSLLARRVLFPGPPRLLPTTVSDDLATVAADPAAAPMVGAPGRYGVWFANGAHAVVGEVERREDGRVVRPVLASRGDVPAGTAPAQWTGHVFPGPEALGLDWREVDIPTPGGPCPAWLFPAPGGVTTGVGWAIHIHGRATTRVTALRSVPATHRAGLASLVVSFRGDGEGPTAPGAPSDLGTREWEDVARAIDTAVAHGATSILLVGWSQGGAIALRAAQRSEHRGMLRGLVLIGPVTSWARAIGQGAAKAGLPRWVGSAVAAVLSTRAGARSAGGTDAYPLAELDWTRADGPDLQHDALVVHSPGDEEVPLGSSRAFAARHPGRVRIAEFAPVPHCMEWNAEPEAFEEAVAAFSRPAPPPRTAPPAPA